MAQVIDGKALAKKIRENLKVECNELKEKGIVPKLAVIMVGDNPASKVYVRNKSKACEDVGIEYQEFLLKENTTQQELMDLINDLNRNKEMFGSVKGSFYITQPFYCDYGFNISIGNNFYTNYNCSILDGAKVSFGDNVFIAPGCVFSTAGTRH